MTKTKKITIIDNVIEKYFYLHKFKATEGIYVMLLVLKCLSSTDIGFKDVMGLEPTVIEAWAHMKLQTGVKNEEVTEEDIIQLNNIMTLRKTELGFHLFKLALRKLEKSKIEELMGYLVYAISLDEVTRLTTASESTQCIDNHINNSLCLFNLLKKCFEYNYKDFFLE